MSAPVETTAIESITERFRSCLSRRDWPGLKHLAERLEPSEVAAMIEDISPAERALLYRSLPRTIAADVFSFLDEDHQQALLRELTEQETRVLLAELSPDDRTFLFEELPAVTAQRLLNLLSSADRSEALMLLGYPEGSVGRLMSPDFATVRPEMTVAEAIEAIRRQAPQSETIHMVYVTDADGHLLDDLRLRKLILEPPERRVADFIGGDPVSLNAFDPEGAAVVAMKETGYFALPVVDSQNILIGVVTADDVLEVAVEEATEDIHKGGAVGPIDTELLETGFFTLYSKRVTWLVLLVFVNIFTGAGIAHHEELIESMVALMFFLPLLIGSGGNAGAQASTLIVRSMALGEIGMRDYFRVFFRESAVSISLGLTMAAAVSLLAWWRSGPDVAMVVGLSMVVIVFVGSMIGASLPFVLKKFKLDPASASAPLVTSIADILGVLIYLGIASALLSELG